MSSIFGSSGVRGFGTEWLTASAIAGSQRYFFTATESCRAEPVTAALPPWRANCFCTLLEVNHSRKCTAAVGFFEPEATPQMNVPIAGPLRSCFGVAAVLILCATLEADGLSIWWT